MSEVTHRRRLMVQASAWLLCAAVLAVTMVPVSAQEGSALSACADAPVDWFLDVGGVHQPGIDCLAWRGIADGKDVLTYAPEDAVTRGQMASLVARSMRTVGVIADSEAPGFTDTAGSVHADAIDALAAAGVVRGTSDDAYEPGLPVTRAQMASFLVRGWEVVAGELPPPAADPFIDIGDSVHADAIRKLADAGWTRGRSDDIYEPDGTVTRAQMATFLARWLSAAVDAGILEARPSNPREPAGLPVGHRWTRVAHQEPAFGGPGADAIHAVVPFGDGLVAVGANWSLAMARAWSSDDGEVWTRHDWPLEVFLGLSRTSMLDVVVGGPGLVAVGRDPGHAAVWVSEDGRQWERLPHDEEVFGAPEPGTYERYSMNAVTAGAQGIVAVGQKLGSSKAVAWTSDDGVEWERHTDESLSGRRMLDVIEGGPGFIAVGSGDAGAAVWTSADGRTWTQADVRAAPDVRRSSTIEAITAFGDGFLAVGGRGQFTPVVWRSPDGREWEHVTDERGVLSQVTLNDVVAVDDILVAVGRDVAESRGGVWISADGAHWHAVSNADGAFSSPGRERIDAVAPWGDRLVAVGSGDGNAVVWITP